MLLYRVIPDQYGMILEKSKKKNGFDKCGLTTEDLFYNLGYINISEHSPYYHREVTEDNKEFLETSEGLSFYTNPWDAVNAIPYLTKDVLKYEDGSLAYFSNNIVRIFEYDIPLDIVNTSWQCVELDDNSKEIPVIKVPIELLKNGHDIKTDITDELKGELTKEAFKNGDESLSKLADIYFRDNEELKGKRAFIVRREKFFFKYRLLKPEVSTKLNILRFSNSGSFFQSEFITGNKLLLTLDEYTEIKKKEQYYRLFDCPFLTRENYIEYRNKEKGKILKKDSNLH